MSKGISIQIRNVPEDLHKFLRITAIEQKRSLQDIALEALKQWAQQEQERSN